ncbi:PLP-dependent aminotransferase family protein [Microbacterium sp. SORGH_AS_0862]|uniref:MocR-like transcription factor YczR n=1 Tax=Microbacterium sp. SORGH_AS_0862 TaxID=3041789 RepID=UPI002792274F|nr:PLP-dependent aminotransferase family protein [Microbacterium sp. SORGH_AS_0862]MDQ1206806.1 DNA-binding transcriptional MocR family regulator [Microbacterium sp. SORGH_AS_0862]
MDSRVSARALTARLGGWRTSEPAYEALADGIRLLCLDNRLPAGTALPAERALASVLGVSRTTVAAAYRSLRDSGHIRSLRGSGSVTQGAPQRAATRTVSDPRAVDLQQASPAAWPGLAGVFAEAAAQTTALLARPGYDVVGREELRAALADQYTRRGIQTTSAQILITSGAQSALHLLATVLVRRGDRVMIESPTYPHAAEALRSAGARLVSVPVTPDEGWDLDRAEQVFARVRPSLAYLMPDFQNPTGRSMTGFERELFVTAAARAGTVLIVDETTADLDIDRAIEPPPFGADPQDEQIVRVGSFGKTVWGGLRVGWIRADEELIRRLIAARFPIELGTPDWEQHVATLLLPHLPEVIAQRAHLLRTGRDTVSAALAEQLPEWTVPAVDGGVALWVELDRPFSSALVLAACAEGILLSAGPRFGVDGGFEKNLRIPFTAAAPDLERAVDGIARAWGRTIGGAAPLREGALDAVV